ncbi:MAG TPA: hypothetical protein VM734_04310, partial [Kofleriaceae bacterium]|nr:hypothetical protein [Kofleriaceae bacterium]
MPLPPPADADEGTSRVRMSVSSYVPETTARDLPVLPIEPWDEETDDEDRDRDFGGITSAVPRERAEALATQLPPAPTLNRPLPLLPPPPGAVDRRTPVRDTVSGLRKPRSHRRLPLAPDSGPTSVAKSAAPAMAAPLPTPPPMPAPRAVADAGIGGGVGTGDGCAACAAPTRCRAPACGDRRRPAAAAAA